MKRYSELEIAEILRGANTAKEIERRLADIPHKRDNDCDYYNIYIPRREDKCVRVYLEKRGRNRYLRIQTLAYQTFSYSGIPVFFG